MSPKLSISVSLGLIVSSMGLASSAQAFSFTTNYTAELTGSDAGKGNIWLDSVEFGGTTVSDFGFVNRVDILQNDLWTGGDSGAASAERGDKADGLSEERLTNAGAVTALGNTNLNNIIDGEDRGAFSMNVWFNHRVNNLFFWERGMNSAMNIQAIDKDGNSIGNLLNLDSRSWNHAGLAINTVEISGAQQVGSFGVSLADLGLSSAISGVRVSALGNSYFNGPDWKVVGSASIPEPGTVVGLMAIAGGVLASRRRQKMDKV